MKPLRTAFAWLVLGSILHGCFGICGTEPAVSIQFTNSTGSNDIQVYFDVENAGASTVYCIAKSRYWDDIPSSAYVQNKSEIYGQTADSSTENYVVISNFPTSAYCFDDGPYFCAYRVFCAAKETSSSSTTGDSCVNSTSVEGYTSGSGNDIITVELVSSTTTEYGGAAEFKFGPRQTVSRSGGGAEVLLTVGSADETEGLPSSDPLRLRRGALYSFTAGQSYSGGDYFTAYMIGQADAEDDGDVVYNGTVAVYATDDSAYDYLPDEGVYATFTLTNEADPTDGPAYGELAEEVGLVAAVLRNYTSEADGDPQVLFGVSLLGPPTGVVQVAVYPDDGTEAIVAWPGLIAFDSDNWNISQHVYAMGVDDSRIDPIIAYTMNFAVISSEDSRYDNAYSPLHFSMGTENREWNTPAIFLGAGNCSLGIVENGAPCSVNLTFCQYPMVDDECRSLSPYYVYNSMGFSAIEVTLSTSNKTAATMTADGDASTVFTVEFDSDSSSEEQIVRWVPVYPADDVYIDPTQLFNVSLDAVTVVDADTGAGTDASTNRIHGSPISSFTQDDDTAEVMFDYDCLNPQTSESGRSCVVAIELASKPRGDVSFTVSEPAAAYALMTLEDGSEAYSVSLTLSPSEWDTGYTVTFVGQDTDTTAQTSNTEYAIDISTLSSTDANFDGARKKIYNFTNLDNDQSGLTLGYPSPLYTDEFGLHQNISVKLDSTPTGSVVVPVSTSYADEISLSCEGIHFLEGSYSSMATDGFKGGLYAAPCSAGEYLDCTGACLSTADCTLSASGYDSCDDWLGGSTCYDGSTSSDSGAAPDFSCSLYAFGDGACPEGGVADVVVGGWAFVAAGAQATLNVTGLDDDDEDGTVAWTVLLGPLYSTDAAFNKTEFYVDGKNYDNDIVTMSTWDCETSEADLTQGCEFSIDVTLVAPHFAGVYYNSTNGNTAEATVDPASQYFPSTGSGDVTVRGLDDHEDDGDQIFEVAFALTLKYTHHGQELLSELYADTINVTNVDNETTGLVFQQGNTTFVAYKSWRDGSDLSATEYPALTSITLPDRATAEADKTETVALNFTLLYAPTAPVYFEVYTEAMSSQGGAERYEGVPTSPTEPQGDPFAYTTEEMYIDDPIDTYVSDVDTVTADSPMLRFEANASNWAAVRELVVTGLDDAVDDYTVTYYLYLTATSDDPAFDGVALNFPLENVDDDKRGVGLYTIDDTCSEPDLGLIAEFGVYLESEPKDAVVMVLSSTDPGEAEPLTTIIAFNSLNWYVPQEIEVASVDDPYKDGTVLLNITVQTLYSKDPDYGASDLSADGQYGLSSTAFKVAIQSLDDLADTAAEACQAGLYGYYPDCESCAPGSYSEEVGDTATCRYCPPGTFGVVEEAQAMGTTANWYGDTQDPGCVPCPEGTYQPGFGATACLSCEGYEDADGLAYPGDYSCGLATTLPVPAALNASAGNGSDSVSHHWELLSLAEFTGEVRMLGSWECNEEQYKLFLLSVGMICVGGITVMIYLAIQKLPHKYMARLEAFLIRIDKFVDEHLEIYGGEGLAIGGLATIASVVIICMLAGMIIHLYIYYNFTLSQGVVPASDAFTRSIEGTLAVQVEFVGFSGCVGDLMDLNGDGADDTEVDLTARNVEVAALNATCADGTLVVSAAGTVSYLTDSVTVTFDVSAPCDSCIDVAASACQNCTVISASNILWYAGSDEVYPGDDNAVTGSLYPSSGEVFRGEDATALEIALVPSLYMNEITMVEINAFRLHHQLTEAGSTVGFATSGNATDEDIVDTWITNNDFTDEDTSNTMSFEFTFSIASWQLNILIGTKYTWMDAWGVLGGLVGSIMGSVVWVMLHFERAGHHETKQAKVIRAIGQSIRKLSPTIRKGYFQDAGHVKNKNAWTPTEESRMSPTTRGMGLSKTRGRRRSSVESATATGADFFANLADKFLPHRKKRQAAWHVNTLAREETPASMPGSPPGSPPPGQADQQQEEKDASEQK